MSRIPLDITTNADYNTTGEMFEKLFEKTVYDGDVLLDEYKINLWYYDNGDIEIKQSNMKWAGKIANKSVSLVFNDMDKIGRQFEKITNADLNAMLDHCSKIVLHDKCAEILKTLIATHSKK